MAPRYVVVQEKDMATCPYCGYVHGETEGSTEMFKNGSCHLTCAKCNKTYRYVESRSAK